MLAAARSLHEGGYEVTVAAFTRRAPTFWSRACGRRLLLTGAREDADCLVEQLAEELGRRSYATLLPGTDAALLVISRGRARLAEFTDLGLPAPAVVERALSRESLVDAAERVGLLAAPSVHCTGTEEALAAAARLGFPMVLKSIDAIDLESGVVRRVPKGQIVTDEEDLKRRVLAFRDGFLVQRFMGEKILSVGGVIDKCIATPPATVPPPGEYGGTLTLVHWVFSNDSSAPSPYLPMVNSPFPFVFSKGGGGYVSENTTLLLKQQQ